MLLQIDGIPVTIDGIKQNELDAIHARLADLLSRSPNPCEKQGRDR